MFLGNPLIRLKIIVSIVVSITQQLKFTIFDRFQLAASFWATTKSVVIYYCYTYCTADFIKKIDFVQRASSVSYGYYINKNL